MLCTHIEGNLNDPSFELALRRRLGGAFAWETRRSTSPLQTATCWDASRM